MACSCPARQGSPAWRGSGGARRTAGLLAAGFAGCNDPALFAGQADGQIDVPVPLDDSVAPDLSEPVTEFLPAHAGLEPSVRR